MNTNSITFDGICWHAKFQRLCVSISPIGRWFISYRTAKMAVY